MFGGRFASTRLADAFSSAHYSIRLASAACILILIILAWYAWIYTPLQERTLRTTVHLQGLYAHVDTADKMRTLQAKRKASQLATKEMIALYRPLQAEGLSLQEKVDALSTQTHEHGLTIFSCIVTKDDHKPCRHTYTVKMRMQGTLEQLSSFLSYLQTSKLGFSCKDMTITADSAKGGYAIALTLKTFFIVK